MAVITISRQFGAGGKTLGKKLSEKLGYTFADTDIIQRIAKEANVSANFVKSIEKEGGTKLSKLINTMVSKKWVDRILGDEHGYMDEQIYLDYLVLIIAQVADEGNAVIIGRGSQYILNDHPDAFHVLLIDELENRIQFMVDNYNLQRSKASKVVNNEDRRRINFYGKLGKTNFDDPALYDLVLNMSRYSMPKAVRMVEALIKP